MLCQSLQIPFFTYFDNFMCQPEALWPNPPQKRMGLEGNSESSAKTKKTHKALRTLWVSTSFLTFQKTSITAPLAAGNFIYPCLMSASFKIRVQKTLYHLFGQFKGNKTCGYGQDVGVVVLTAQCR